MTILIDHPARAARPSLPALRLLFKVLARLASERAERRELAGLDGHMLADIGLNRAIVELELDRPIWRPVDWRALERARWCR